MIDLWSCNEIPEAGKIISFLRGLPTEEFYPICMEKKCYRGYVKPGALPGNRLPDVTLRGGVEGHASMVVKPVGIATLPPNDFKR